MNLRIKYILIILLWIYAQAIGMNVLHHHADDAIHCYNHSEKHLHSQIHHCSLCDCSLQLAGYSEYSFSSNSKSQIITEVRTSVFSSFKENIQLIPCLRGPPLAFVFNGIS